VNGNVAPQADSPKRDSAPKRDQGESKGEMSDGAKKPENDRLLPWEKGAAPKTDSTYKVWSSSDDSDQPPHDRD
jgi:hypothetical protein